MMGRRGTTNTNSRGSAAQRRVRKTWLLAEFGDGEKAPCSFDGCAEVLTFDTITVDRFPVAGVDGGTYRRGNIRPACAAHNSEHGGRLRWQRVRARERVAGAFRAGFAPARLGGSVRLSPALSLIIDPM